MAAIKTQAETHDKTAPGPVAVKLPETPEKAAGPQRVARMAEGSAAPPPPNGAPSPARSAELLTSGSNGPGAPLRAQMMRNLQRSVGNTRVSSLLGRQIQTKLSVGAVDDPQEREADRVAETVTQPGTKSEPTVARQIVTRYSLARLPTPQPETKKEQAVEPAAAPATEGALPATAENQSPNSSPIQRKCDCPGEASGGTCTKCQSEQQTVQRQTSNDDSRSRLMEKGARAGEAGLSEQSVNRSSASESLARQAEEPTESAAIGPSVGKALNSGDGRPLDKVTRTRMEDAFGKEDFSGVRIHTSRDSEDAAKEIQVKAFTTGQDIHFAKGEFQPETSQGEHLLAHELTHTVQQASGRAALQSNAVISQPDDPLEREAESVATRVSNNERVSPVPVASGVTETHRMIARQTQGEGAAGNSVIDEAVKAIIEDLKGVTTRWASARILERFQQNSGSARAILQGLKKKAGEEGMTPEAMIDWLFGDMTAEDSRALRGLLIKVGAVDDLARITANTVKELLEGYTSESNSAEIYAALADFAGAQLDTVLARLQSASGKGAGEMSEWLFGDMDRVNAERLRQLFFANGGGNAVLYATRWTASKIHSLLSGYTGHSDSSAIVWNFQNTPLGDRIIVQGILDTLTATSRNETAEDALMKSVDKSDYEALIKMGGLRLAEYKDKRNWMQKTGAVLEWNAIVGQWVVCGIIGVITGILTAIWEIIKGLWDIVVGAKHLLGSLVYLISGGSVGSSDWLAVKEFFGGLIETLGHPKNSWNKYWDNLALEFNTIEGPLADCLQAEFIVRKFITAVVNILLIFLAGYGLAKMAVSAATGAAELAALARQVGILRALVQVGGRAGRALGKLVTVGLEEAVRIGKAVLSPVQTLIKVGKRINLLMAASKEQGVWKLLRKQGGALLEHEKKFWEEKKEKWSSRAEKHQERHAELSNEAGDLQESLEQGKAPEQPDKVTQTLADDAKNLDENVDDLYKEVTEPEKKTAEEPGKTGPVQTETPLPKSWEKFEAANHEEFKAELSKFRGDDDLSPFASGGEGRIFNSQKNPIQCLKRWFKSRLSGEQGMGESIRKLKAVRSGIDSTPKLGADVEVVKVYKEGSDWILRDFDPTSRELKVFLQNGDVDAVAARTRAIAALEGTTDADLRDFLKRLRKDPPSANYHWSPTSKKILIIDMQ